MAYWLRKHGLVPAVTALTRHRGIARELVLNRSAVVIFG